MINSRRENDNSNRDEDAAAANDDDDDDENVTLSRFQCVISTIWIRQKYFKRKFKTPLKGKSQIFFNLLLFEEKWRSCTSSFGIKFNKLWLRRRNSALLPGVGRDGPPRGGGFKMRQTFKAFNLYSLTKTSFFFFLSSHFLWKGTTRKR